MTLYPGCTVQLSGTDHGGEPMCDTVEPWPAGADTLTAELPRGWHRVTWMYFDRQKHVVTPHVTSACDAHSALEYRARDCDWITNVVLHSWSDRLDTANA